ncbi:MAG: TonB-dependent receptor [Nitrospinae bacterium]|nr:TonB-dependent receptor [Nitrospinota bacterium]
MPPIPRLVALSLTVLLVAGAGKALAAPARDASLDALLAMDMESLLALEVTSVSRKEERLFDVASAIFVLTAEDIRRSGATTIPDALALVPGVFVARLDSQGTAVSVRGFTSRFNSMLLVMIDGRSVYTPLHGGVEWLRQDTLLEDVERIEVIRGPGSSVWGANAVNGVINIITRNARETRGALASGTVGTVERGSASLRYGDAVGEKGAYRVWGKSFNREGGMDKEGNLYRDGMSMNRGGARYDGFVDDDTSLSVQTEGYATGDRAELIATRTGYERHESEFSGGHLMASVERLVGKETRLSFQAYYDTIYQYAVVDGYRSVIDTFDADLHGHWNLDGLLLDGGAGWRAVRFDQNAASNARFEPQTLHTNLYSGFAQATVPLFGDGADLVVGSKVEHNDFTGVEFQPTLRISGNVAERQRLWGAVTRSVRTPTRADDDLIIDTSYYRLDSAPDLASETALAYELGWRAETATGGSVDLALFYTVYDDLSTEERGETEDGRTRIYQANKGSATVAGGELSTSVRPVAWWRVTRGLTAMEVEAALDADSTDTATVAYRKESTPQRQALLRSQMDLPHGVELDATFGWYGRTPQFDLGERTRLDLRLGWRPDAHLDVALVGKSLQSERELEFVDGRYGAPVETQRSVFLKMTWRQ